MRILYHAINGTGLGHLMRLSALAAAVRVQAPHVHQLIVTNASYSAHFKRMEVPVMVLPDRTGPPTEPNKRVRSVSGRFAANLLSHVVDEYNPRLVVFDTHVPMRMARKSMEEGRKTVLVFRACREEYLQRYLRDNFIADFDLVLIPHTREEFFGLLSRSAVGKLRRLRNLKFVGAVVFPADISAEIQADVCCRHHIRPDAKLVVVSAGGGGVARLARRMFDSVCAAAAELRALWPTLQVLCVGGPYADRMSLPEGCIYVQEEPAMQALMCRADVLVARPSYNTVHEALRCGTPTVLVPATCWRTEDTEARIAFYARRERVLRLDLGAPVTEYIKVIDRVLRSRRPSPETCDGAAHAAMHLLDETSDAQLLICSREPLARSLAFSFETVPALVHALQGLEGPLAVVRIDWDLIAALLSRLDESARSRIDTMEITLGDCSVEDAADRIRETHTLLRAHGAADRSVLFCVNDPSGGTLLVKLAAAVRDLRFNALIARVSPDAMQKRAREIFDNLVACRELGTPFKIDITLLESSTVFVDQP